MQHANRQGGKVISDRADSVGLIGVQEYSIYAEGRTEICSIEPCSPISIFNLTLENTQIKVLDHVS